VQRQIAGAKKKEGREEGRKRGRKEGQKEGQVDSVPREIEVWSGKDWPRN
jgi:flagellar biosynthesis/type III secretory pathway protein FliH